MIAVVASIPSPGSGAIHIGPLQLRAYGFMIAVGVLSAEILGGAEASDSVQAIAALLAAQLAAQLPVLAAPAAGSGDARATGT